MDASPAHAADFKTIVSPRQLDLASRACGATLIGMLALVALIVAIRRVAGALTDPLPWSALFAVGLLAISTAAVARWLWERDAGLLRPWQRACATWLPRAALVGLGLGLLVPGTSWLVAVLLIAGGIASDRWLRRGWRDQTPEPDIAPRVVEVPTLAMPRLLHDGDERIEQRLIRSVAADGVDKLDGTLRSHFAAGQRTAWVHAAFCPPFGVVPQVVVRQQSGPQARITVGSLLPYGVRFDLKLVGTSDEAQTVDLEFTATARAASIRAHGDVPMAGPSASGHAQS